MSVDALLRQLVQGDEDARIEAAEALPAAGDRRAVGALVQALRDEAAGVRAAACEALGRVADARAVPPLVSLLRDPHDEVQGEAFSALLRIGQARASSLPDYRGEDPRSPSLALTQIVWPADLEAVKLLYESLADPDPEVRIGCAYALGRMGVAGAYDAVVRLLDDADPEVRCAAAFALGDLALAGEARAVPMLARLWPRAQADDELAVVVVRALAEVVRQTPRSEAATLHAALGHRDARVRQLAVMGLAGLPGTTAALVARLDDDDVGVRRNAAYALGHSGDAAAINALIGVVPHSDAEVRSAVGEALRHLPSTAVQAALSRAFSSENSELRQAAAYLQGQLRQPAGLVDALHDADPEVRKTAALALGECGDRRFRPTLEGALADDHWRVRTAAAEGLRRLGDPAAVSALARHASDPHPVAGNAIGFALRALEGR